MNTIEKLEILKEEARDRLYVGLMKADAVFEKKFTELLFEELEKAHTLGLEAGREELISKIKDDAPIFHTKDGGTIDQVDKHGLPWDLQANGWYLVSPEVLESSPKDRGEHTCGSKKP